MKKSVVFVAISVFLLASCSKEEKDYLLEKGDKYFPFEPGRYIIYDVDSIVHNDFTATVDTFHYQIKEFFESFYLDNSNRQTMRIERYKRNFNHAIPYDSINWTLTAVWSANKTPTTAEKVEENNRYIKLVFPIEENKEWNGNAYTIFDEKQYTYGSLNEKRVVGSFLFDSTVFVEQQNRENLLEKKYDVEVYAKNIGLIYKEAIDVSAKNIIPGVPLLQRISSGVEYKMTINSYGQN